MIIFMGEVSTYEPEKKMGNKPEKKGWKQTLVSKIRIEGAD